jgi:hypothetical protein
LSELLNACGKGPARGASIEVIGERWTQGMSPGGESQLFLT